MEAEKIKYAKMSKLLGQIEIKYSIISMLVL